MNREPMYSDAYIDYWGQVFEQLGLALRGYDFEEFLKNPSGFLDDSDPLPLLRKQRNVQKRLDAQCQTTRDAVQTRRGCEVELHGNLLVQPLHKRGRAKQWKTHTRSSSKGPRS